METKTKRQELIARMQSILAESGDNELTAEQQAEFDKCKAQIDLIDVSGADDNGVLPRKVPTELSDSIDGKSGWVDTQGKAVKVYGHSDKMGSGEYSVGKYVKGIVTGNWDGADKEHELFATTTTNNSAGGYTVPSILHQEFIDLARANMVCSQAGCNVVELQPGQNKILRVLTDPTAEVKAELDSFTATNPTFDLIEFSPYTVGTYVQVSAELAADGQNFEQILQQVMTQAVAAKLDYLGLYGTGSSQPTGIANYTGINTSPVSTFDYDEILDGLKELQADNCSSANSYIVSPTVNNTLAKLKDSQGNYLNPPADVTKLSKFVTTSMQDDDLIVGDFSNMYLGLRQGITFQTSPVADDSFKKYAYAFRVVMRADWALVRPNHFCLCSTNVS